MAEHQKTEGVPAKGACSAQAGPKGTSPAPTGNVPYITTWSAERVRPPRVLLDSRRPGITFDGELLHDRDSHGALWARTPSRQGEGRPEFGRVHALRQRRVMQRLGCQICAGPADRNEQGVLWLLHDDRSESPDWPEQVGATHPPVCLPCAAKSARLCPHLRGRHVAVRVRHSRVHGVYGALYGPGPRRPEPVGRVIVGYGDPRLRWVVASQLVRRLEGCTVVDLWGPPLSSAP